MIGLGLGALLGSLGAAGISTIGGLFSSSSANSASKSINQQNVDLQRETNAQNLDMFNRELDWSRESQGIANDFTARENQLSRDFNSREAALSRDWSEAMYNKYSSPQSQMKALREAGINPYSALAGITGNTVTASSGASSSAGSGVNASLPSVPNLTAPHAQFDSSPYQIMANSFNGVARLANDYFSNAKTESETRLNQIDAISRLDSNIAHLEWLKADKDIKAAQKREVDNRIDLYNQTRNQLIRQAELNNDILESQNQNIKQSTAESKARTYTQNLQSEALELSNDYARSITPYQVKAFLANMNEVISRTNLNYASAGAQIANAALANMQKIGVKIDNFQKNQVNYLIREGVKLDNRLKRLDLGEGGMFSGKYNPLNTVLNGLVGVAGSAAGAYLGAAGGILGKNLARPNLSMPVYSSGNYVGTIK